MANTFITPKVIASRALATLYNTTVLAALVNRDYDPEFTGNVGDTVTVRTPAVFVAKKFDRTAGIVLQDIVEGSFDVKLDTIYDVSFPVTAEELTLSLDRFDERVLTPAMEAISQQVDADLAELLVDTALGVGGGGVVNQTLNATTLGRNASINARTKLGRNKIPTSNRAAVLSPEAAAILLSDDLFVEAQKRGNTDGLIEAAIGRKFGFDHYESQVFGYGGGDKGQADGVAFHRDAVTLASRTLQVPDGVAASQAAVSNYKGLGLRVVKQYDINKKQDICSVDFLGGYKAIRAGAAVELNYGQGS